jgi:hypothetical protein
LKELKYAILAFSLFKLKTLEKQQVQKDHSFSEMQKIKFSCERHYSCVGRKDNIFVFNDYN